MFNAPKCPQPRCDGQGKPLQADLWKCRPNLEGRVIKGRDMFTAYITGEWFVAVWFCPYCGQVERVEDVAAWAYDFASTQFANKLTDLQVKWKRFKLW